MGDCGGAGESKDPATSAAGWWGRPDHIEAAEGGLNAIGSEQNPRHPHEPQVVGAGEERQRQREPSDREGHAEASEGSRADGGSGDRTRGEAERDSGAEGVQGGGHASRYRGGVGRGGRVSLWTSPRCLPKVDALMAEEGLADLPAVARREAVRAVLDRWRAAIVAGATRDGDTLVQAVRAHAQALLAPHLREVLNATGVVLHTNLGRAPWSDAAREAVLHVTRSSCNLEIDLETGRRGGRGAGALAWMTRLSGAEAALLVNNAAAGVLLALTALAGGRRVLISRGELVEIGGGFRVPDVIAACGAQLTEVGTTNRTHLADYARALTADVAAVLVVHPSNFRQVGFVASPALAELVSWAHGEGLPVVYDQGSGAWRGDAASPGVEDAIEAGCDVVIASGDKGLGGPQAGLVFGRRATIERMASHPLMRALRVDKAILAAVEATLRQTWLGCATPAQAQASLGEGDLHARAVTMAAALGSAGWRAEVVPCEGTPGGGTAPDVALPGYAVVVRGVKAESLATVLRRAQPAVIGRVVDGSLGFDLRTVHPADDVRLTACLVGLAADGWTG